MKKFLLIVMILAVFPVFGYAQKTTVKIQDTQARIVGINPTAYVNPLTVELQVHPQGRISDTWPLTIQQVEKDMGGQLDNIRSWALFMSCQKANADVIIAPMFNFKSTDEGDGYTITVVGFPANFVNWHTATKDDYEWMRMEKTQTTAERESIQAAIRK